MTFPDPARLPLAKLVAQMVVIRTTGFLFDHQLQYPQWEVDAQKLQYLIATVGVGGIILLGGSAPEVALKTQQMQHWAELPLLICADIEEGVGQRFPGATWFPPPMALSGAAQTDLPQAISLATQMGATIAQEALAIGINWILTPTVDVNNNPHNPVINVRAFGETAAIVSQITTAYIRGAQKYAVLTTAKHFPGHGDTAIDSHWDLPLISHDRTHLDQVELAPFKSAIAAGVDSVMSAHLNVPALDPEQPTTFSRPVMTDLLRGDMGFDGVIVTDALVMGAIVDRYGNAEAAVRSVAAGADVLMMPIDAEGAIAAVCAAVETGRISREQIERSVARIWAAKQKVMAPTVNVTTVNATTVNATALMAQLATPSAMQSATAIVQASIKVHSDRQLEAVTNGCNLLITDTVLDSRLIGRLSPAITVPPKYGFTQLQIIDQNTPTWVGDNSTPTLLQLFIRGNPLRGIHETIARSQQILVKLLATQQLQGLILYGSPYVFEEFSPRLPPSLPCLFSYGQMPAAQAIALDRLFGQPGVTVTDRDGMF
jgi:beta-glucosidase